VPGDLTVCIQCACILQFTAAMDLEVANAMVLALLDDQSRAVLLRVHEAVYAAMWHGHSKRGPL
jgi:hypothetical protein